MSEAIISGKSGSTTYAKMNLSYSYTGSNDKSYYVTSGSYAGSTISKFMVPTAGTYVASDIVYAYIRSSIYLWVGSSTSADRIELPEPCSTFGYYYYAGETVSSSFTVTSDDGVNASGTMTATLDRSTGITITYTMSSTTFYYVNGDSTNYRLLWIEGRDGLGFGLKYI